MHIFMKKGPKYPIADMTAFSELEHVRKIYTQLKFHPKGLTISDISRKLRMNRNSVAKYLEILLVEGRVEVEHHGAAKVYYPSHRVPISAMLSFSSDLIFVMDLEGRIIHVNNNLIDFFNIPREGFLGFSLDDCKSPCLQWLNRKLKESGASMEQMLSMDLSCDHREGRRYFNARIIPTVFDDGSRGITVMMEDITKRRQAEDAVKESEERFKAMAELSPFPIAIIEGDGRYRYLNRKFNEVFGYTLQDIPDGRTWFELAYSDPESKIMAIRAWKEDLEGAETGAVRPRLFEVRCKNGEIKEILFRPVSMPDGTQFITYEDVSDKNRAERLRTLVEAIVQASDDAIVALDPAGTVLTWNRGAERISRISAREAIGQRLGDLVEGQDTNFLNSMLKHVSEEARSCRWESFWTRRDGEKAEVYIRCAPMYDKTNHLYGYSVVVSDISERRRAEKESLIKESAIASSTTGIGILELSWRFQYVNRAMEEMFASDGNSELTGEPIERIAGGDVVAVSALSGIKETVERKGEWGGEFLIRSDRGPPRIYRLKLNLARDRSGGPLCTILSIDDLSQMRDLESEIRLNRKKLREIIEFLPDPTFVVDRKGHVIGWNKQIEKLTGVPADEMIGKGDYEYAIPFYGERRPVLLDFVEKTDQETVKYYPNFRRIGKTIHSEVLVPRLKNRYRAYFWAKASPLYDEEGDLIGAIESIRDITQWMPMVDSDPQ